jgi:hypothetical protein
MVRIGLCAQTAAGVGSPSYVTGNLACSISQVGGQRGATTAADGLCAAGVILRDCLVPQEVQVITRRRDGSPGRPRTIWVVGDRDRIFIRSTNGRIADWFRGAIATGTGQIVARGTAYDVAFTEADDGDLAAVDAAYRLEYGRYASIVDHLEGDGPRAATLQVHPA